MSAEQQPKVRRIYRGIKSVRSRCDGAAASTIYEWMAKAGFPKPVKFANGHSNVWDADAVDSWIERQFTKTQPQGGQA